jgi:hypothetical protein
MRLQFKAKLDNKAYLAQVVAIMPRMLINSTIGNR